MNNKKLNMFCLKMIAKTCNISVNSRILKNDFVSLLKKKLPRGIFDGRERLRVCLADEKPERSINFFEEMRLKLRLADDKIIIFYRDEDGELYMSQSIDEMIKIERGREMSFRMRNNVEMIEDDVVTVIEEDITDYPRSFLELRSMKERLRRSFEFVESLTDEEESDESLKETERKKKQSTKESNDEEAKQGAVKCGICLINTPKLVFTSFRHCDCIRCAKRLDKCHICRKKIYQRMEIFLG